MAVRRVSYQLAKARTKHCQTGRACSAEAHILTDLTLISAYKLIADTNKDIGEDALFATNRAFGVADGVSGWWSYGVNPAEYAWLLCDILRSRSDNFTSNNCPLQLLIDSKSDLDEAGIDGGCTALVGIIEGRTLKVANLGDSRLVVFREEEGVFSEIVSSAVQQHYFNCPYQLASDGGDGLEKADVWQMELQKNDLIVSSTDGMWDNLFVEDVTTIINQQPRLTSGYLNLSHLSLLLARLAHKVAKDPLAQTPFAHEAERQRLKYNGGKMDDVTVICSQLVNSF